MPRCTKRAGSALHTGHLRVRDRRTGRSYDGAVRLLADGRAVLAGWIGDGSLVDPGADAAARDAFLAGAPFGDLAPVGTGWRRLDVGYTLPGEVAATDRVQRSLDGGWWDGLLEAAGTDASVLDACARRLGEVLREARQEQRALPLDRLQELLFDRLAAGPAGAELIEAATLANLSPVTRPVA
jgi:hypothetical protein